LISIIAIGWLVDSRAKKNEKWVGTYLLGTFSRLEKLKKNKKKEAGKIFSSV
jgi:hypothetical protein